MKEKIKSAITNGLLNKDVTIFALLELVSEEQLSQSSKFSLFSEASELSTQSKITTIQTSTSELDANIKTLVPDAVFAGGDIPDCCKIGDWDRFAFYKGCDRCMVFWTQNLDAYKMPELILAMKTGGCTMFYCEPYVHGEWEPVLRGERPHPL